MVGSQLAGTFEKVICMDYSEAVIKRMRAKNKRKNVQYEAMDARNLSKIESSTATCVLDKGLLDASSLHGGNSEARAVEAVADAHKILAETKRILMSGGVFLLISSVPPERYMPLLKADKTAWSDIQCSTLDGNNRVHVYSLTKRELTIESIMREVKEAREAAFQATSELSSAQAGVNTAKKALAEIEAEKQKQGKIADDSMKELGRAL